MVRALLDGSKTQTRRVCKLNVRASMPKPEWDSILQCCPYGKPGDRLWVRETWWLDEEDNLIIYRADPDSDVVDVNKHETGFAKYNWKPSIFMPRCASRITLEITGVRVERLQDISAADALDEGIKIAIDSETKEPLIRISGKFPPAQYASGYGIVIAEYASLWEQINGSGSWDLNPWVWVIEFKVVKP